jgi:hypothetical protein
MIPAPQIMPKLDLRPIFLLIFDKSRIHSPPLLMFFHSPTLKGPTSLENHPPLILSYLISSTDIYNASLSMAKYHNGFPSELG